MLATKYVSKILCQIMDFRCTSASVNVGIGNKFFTSNISVCFFTPNVMLKSIVQNLCLCFIPNVGCSLYQRVSQCRNR